MKIPRLDSVVKVTTAPGTATPAALLTVALTVTEPEDEPEV